MAKQTQLSVKTIAVMELIAGGNSYEQILRTDPAITYRDISDAAQEVITRVVEAKSRLDEIREQYPRAYMKWTPEEDARLEEILRQGEFVSRIAKALERGREGIRSRIIKLDLVDLLPPEDRAEFEARRDRFREARPSVVSPEETHALPDNGNNQTDGEAGNEPAPPVEPSSLTAAQRMGHPLART